MSLFGRSSTQMSTSTNPKNELENLFSKILSPIKKVADPNLVAQFCHKLNDDLEGAQIALDLIQHKMQSTQEWEALIALYVLEACVKNCGDRFHDLINRFRFLNEMIKLVSPKYYASRTSETVKKRVVELMYSWVDGLPQKTKIREAYEMLKKQGIVEADPTYVDKLIVTVPSRSKNTIFEDPDKGQQLAKLLKSKNPQDLELANRIIKNMVKQDEIKTEKISNRINDLEHINNNIKLLNEMMLNHNKTTASESERETIKYLYDELTKLQPHLAQLATETDDNDDGLGDILKTNDQCERIITQYKAMFEYSNNLMDVGLVNIGLMVDANIQNKATNSPLVNTKQNHSSTNGSSQYDPLRELEDLFSTNTSTKPTQSINDSFGQMNLIDSSVNSSNQALSFKPISSPTLMTPLVATGSSSNVPKPLQVIQQPSQPQPTPQIRAINELNELGRSLMEKSRNDPKISLNSVVSGMTDWQEKNQASQTNKNLSLNELQQQNNKNIGAQLQTQPQQLQTKSPLLERKENVVAESSSDQLFTALNNLNIKLESIKPSTIPPLTLYEQNNLKLVLHFAKDSPVQNVHIIVLSATSTNMASALKNFSFQAAVPKSMKVKLQPASRSDLPIYNPILPPAAITQIMLIANPNQTEAIRLRYKLSFAFDDNLFNETDEVNSLPVHVDLI